MKSYSILSPNDGQLLIRFHDECVKAGMKSKEEWNEYCNPNVGNYLAYKKNREVYNYCLFINIDNKLLYSNNDCAGLFIPDPELINLTPENFDEVLKKVLVNN